MYTTSRNGNIFYKNSLDIDCFQILFLCVCVCVCVCVCLVVGDSDPPIALLVKSSTVVFVLVVANTMEYQIIFDKFVAHAGTGLVTQILQKSQIQNKCWNEVIAVQFYDTLSNNKKSSNIQQL